MSVERIAVLGAGTMGHGFAVHFTRFGIDVALVDHRRENLVAAEEAIREAASFLQEAGRSELKPQQVADAVTFSLDREAAVSETDLVLETVTEDLSVKAELFRDVVESTPRQAILATNTSGIPITEIASAVPDAADRVVGCHWWNPPYLMPTVELVRGEETSAETVARTEAFLEAVDRSPIRVERDVPGFVWNRIQMAVLREAMHLVEAGVASPADVNRAVRDGYALRSAAVGPLETVDLAGLELFRTVAAEIYPHLSDADEPAALMDERIDAGRTGVDAGSGFFEYEDPPGTVRRRRDAAIAAIRDALE